MKCAVTKVTEFDGMAVHHIEDIDPLFYHGFRSKREVRLYDHGYNIDQVMDRSHVFQIDRLETTHYEVETGVNMTEHITGLMYHE